MPILLHLVRHGQTSWNVTRRIQGQTESQLNETGQAQAVAIGDQLRTVPFKAIYCSTSQRTRQTLELMRPTIRSPVSYRSDLREMCFGVWEGQLWQDIEKQFPEMVQYFRQSAPEYDVQGAETHTQLQQRGLAAIEAILEEHRDNTGNILIVSHGALLKRILAGYAGIDLAERTDIPTLENCSHSTIRVDNKQRRLVTVAGKPVEETPWGATAPQGS